MPAFQFAESTWALLVADVRVLCEVEQEGCFEATDIYGQKIVFAHAGPSGLLAERPARIRSLKPDAVVCCYPHQAKRLYPDLPIVGNWSSKTHVHGSGANYILSIEEGRQ